MTNSAHARVVIVLGFLPFLFGCSSHQKADAQTSDVALHSAKQADPNAWLHQRIADRPGNTMGRVFIVMYHHFKAGRGDLFCTPKQFKNDLQTFYDKGFRPVLASEYLANKMPLPPGTMPIILTFDDSNPTQVHFRNDGTLDPNCALGVWRDFSAVHPDFPVHGTFFVMPGTMWGQMRKYRQQKIKMVLDFGSEIENHTINHPFLNRLSDERVKHELGECNRRLIQDGQKPPISVALPYGVMPRHVWLFRGFKYKGEKVHFSGVFLAAGPPARSPNDPKFNRFRIPRMAGNWKGDAIGFWMKQLDKGKIKAYVQP